MHLSDFENSNRLKKADQSNLNIQTDYKASLQDQFKHLLGHAGEKSIAEKMTNRSIRRDRLIERMKDVLMEEFGRADRNQDK